MDIEQTYSLEGKGKVWDSRRGTDSLERSATEDGVEIGAGVGASQEADGAPERLRSHCEE